MFEYSSVEHRFFGGRNGYRIYRASSSAVALQSRRMYLLRVRSHSREELIEFTDQVQEKLRESGAREGIVVLYVQHTTAGLTVNENADPDVPRDMLHALRTLIPQQGMGFRHGEENQDTSLHPVS